MRHLAKVHVRWDDLDAFGHVNNATYLTLVQEARVDMTWVSRKLAGLEPVMTEMVVARAEVDYLLPIYETNFDIDVEIWVIDIKRAAFTLEYAIKSNAGLHSRIKSVQVAINPETKRARSLTEDEVAFLQQYLEAAE
jgi:acyl-CoA thioester hydrolase